MDRNESHMNVKLGKTEARSPSRAEPDVSYAELNFKTRSAPRVRKDRVTPLSQSPSLPFSVSPLRSVHLSPLPLILPCDLNSTYSDLNFRKEKPGIDQDEDPPIASRPSGLSTTTQTAAQEQESKVKIGNRPYRLICLLCLVTSALIVIVAGLSIHVSQIRPSKITSDRNCHDINSTLQSKVSALYSNLTVLKRMHSDLRHQLTEMETKCRSVNKTKAQICELLTSRREKACSQDWIKNEDRCYFISTSETSYDGAKEHCSKVYARLLKINSTEEENVVSNALVHQDRTYWIGKCAHGEAVSSLMYKHQNGNPVCGNCDSDQWRNLCNRHHHFICEKSGHLFKDIPEKIQDLCQQSVGPT
ncbi:oxidized low-density lipoprotein receptor 1-like [Hypanus sabinus]|uniref:oxidized low-density lipoprotein receptor 1-like n=1 Tax=Hypanus sabinus TaxID=79690 RepID=UPI0028C46342|nr:oxidized low-density lipoprotein receptor 1-like [Hypanus sabinus]